MNLTPVKTPKLFQNIIPGLVWSLPSKEKVIYLTFDDGPTPEITPWVLKTLKKFNAKATFFCIGNNVKTHPEIYKQIIEQGHSVGNHSFSHVKGWNTKSEDYLNDINKASELIQSKLFRPPYGKLMPKQAKLLNNLNYKIIMWSVLSIDWDKKVSPEICLKNVIDKTRTGDIVVFHDSIKASQNMQYALPEVLDYFSKKGFEFKRIPEPIL